MAKVSTTLLIQNAGVCCWNEAFLEETMLSGGEISREGEQSSSCQNKYIEMHL